MTRLQRDAAMVARLVAEAERAHPEPKQGKAKKKAVRAAARAELGIRCLLWIGRAIEVAVATIQQVQKLGPPPGLDD